MAAARVSERWLGEQDHPLQSRVVALAEDQDWAVRQQAVASMGALPPGVRERLIAAVLERRALDPIIADIALSGLRGTEATVLTMLLQPKTERTAAREAAITVVAATIARSGQESAVIELFQRTADSARPDWQRAALLRGAEVALAGAPMPGIMCRYVRRAPRRCRVRRVPVGAPAPAACTRLHVRPTGRQPPVDRMLLFSGRRESRSR